ncbi:MAG: BNR-4 repeat-containing protein [Thermogutta sp.]
MQTVLCLGVIIFGLTSPRLLFAANPGESTITVLPEDEVSWAVGGAGGAYFLASEGKLTVEVYKRDLHRFSRVTELRAILVSPDRQVVAEARIPDDGLPSGKAPGSFYMVRLETEVERPGVYGLNVTISQDRYGEEIAWGFRTNCRHYVIETARGHRDEAHREPIVLLQPGKPGDVVFLPPNGEFGIEASDLPRNIRALRVFDAKEQLLAELPVTAEGTATHRFEATVSRDAIPWRIHFPKQQGVLHIDGVTQWRPEDRYRDLTVWTPSPEAWFDWLPNRWLITPYRRTVYGEPNTEGTIAFRVRNDALTRRTISVTTEFPKDPWPARIESPQSMELKPGETKEVRVRYQVGAAEETRVCFFRVRPLDQSNVTTYARLTVIPGTAPARSPLTLPLILRPYEHENEQLGYLPDYPVENQVYFDMENRPYVSAGGVLHVWDGDKWDARNLSEIVQWGEAKKAARSASAATPKVAFDRANRIYLVGQVDGRSSLLVSWDGARTFLAYPLPGLADAGCTFDMEVFTGHNTLDGPPPILRYTFLQADPKVFWRRLYRLELILPELRGKDITFAPPVVVSEKVLGHSAHSGCPSCVVSREGRVHVIWSEATDPGEKIPGAPTYVVTYDRATKTLGQRAFVGYGPPPNDVHNTPSITMDSKGYLHSLGGTHGAPFPYARSLVPNDAGSGWTEPKILGEGLRQTYIGLVCGRDDTLHAVFRLWKSQEPPHTLSIFATLSHQQKPAEEEWQPPRVLVIPPFSEYSVFYHRLTIDRWGRLFLSYNCWSTYWFYRNDFPGVRRALLMSADGGRTWKLATQADLGQLLPLAAE